MNDCEENRIQLLNRQTLLSKFKPYNTILIFLYIFFVHIPCAHLILIKNLNPKINNIDQIYFPVIIGFDRLVFAAIILSSY